MMARTAASLSLAAAAVAAALLAAPPAPAAGPAWRAGTPADVEPVPIVARDSLIRADEKHLGHLRQVTFGGENAEAYWSADGRALVMQASRGRFACDQIFLHRLEDERTVPTLVSTGTGLTTCSYFLTPRRILFASTHLGAPDCPPPPDRSRGYAWALYPDFDIFVRDLDTGDITRLTDTPGYDAEATVSPDGKRVVFTSVRDGDLDIYTMDPDGGNVKRLTHELGYDGGPFFSPDGQWICYRTDSPSDSAEVADYRALLAANLVRPGKLDLWVMRGDGSDKRRVTDLPGASFAPFFTPDGKRLIFSSNHENPRGRDFNLYLVNLDGTGLERVTSDPAFDGFPMFSPDGRWLAFSSNRGASRPGETNVFVAEWKEWEPAAAR